MANLHNGAVLENTYEIIEEIGSGGSGIIFRARHLRLQTDVVVKKIRDELLGKVKSRQEANILKNLKHPYLPRIYDFIETEGSVYTVMDYIHGDNLSDAVKRHGRFTEKQVRKWAEQLGEALAYLHNQKPAIIHSDIKPANIMLTSEGNVCLIDFNISLAMGGTMESAVGISAGYSPPEQYRDPALYERITHQYTHQRVARAAKKSMVDGTEILNGAQNQSETQNVSGIEAETVEIFRTKTLQDDDWAMQYDDDGWAKTDQLWADIENSRTSYENKTEILSSNANVSSYGNRNSDYKQYIGRGIDTRSDIYSLGVTLTYMLTGVEPSVDFEKRIPLSKMNVSVNEGFSILLEKMTDVDPAARYQDGVEFLKAVRNCHKLDHRYIVMHRKERGLRVASVACLCLGILFGFGGAYQMGREKNSVYVELLQRAAEAMNQYEYEEAGELLAEAKELSEERIDAYEEELYLLYQSGEYESCVSLGDSYINASPFLVRSAVDEEQLGNLYYVVGNAYFEMDDYGNAVKLFEDALGHYAGNSLYYRDYAITLAKMGQIENAQKALEDGIALGLGEDSIYMAQGEIAHVKGDYSTAAEYLKQTIATTEDKQMRKRAVLLCTDVYKSMGEAGVDEEIALLEQYAGQSADNEDPVVSEYLAEAYVRKAKSDETGADVYYDKALTLFLSVYEKGYVTWQLQENIAILYESLGRFDDAESLLLEMAERYPKRYEVYKRLAFLEADKQQKKENTDRDYQQMLVYYEYANELYDEKKQDMEMQMLDTMMRDLKDGGWL